MARRLPPSLPPSLCSVALLTLSVNIFAFVPLLHVFLNSAAIPGASFFSPRKTKKQRSDSDSVTLPRLHPSIPLSIPPSLVCLSGAARVVRLSVSMKLKYSCARSAPSNNR